ncbi:MAG TPA: hypothetical protein VE688_01750 [Gaiellaceae bacterium]|nr:hypothetical protein [Gaiellaceae bacterium]
MTTRKAAAALREQVRARYAEAARTGCCCSGESDGCCGDDSCGTSFGGVLYDAETRETAPEAAVLASLGCGNPTAVAELREGEAVLDLGSGGGLDVILSAKRVGPGGVAYGLDSLAPEDCAEQGSYVGCIAGALSKSEYVADSRRPASRRSWSSSRMRSRTGCTARS